MNTRKFFILGLSAALLTASCRKQDLVQENTPAVAPASWTSVSNWSSSTEENQKAYSSSISDKGITADVVENGLVLVYMKSGNAIESMPFHQSANNTYWYYQVSENSLQLNADVPSAGKLGEGQSFSYFIVTAERLKALEDKGLSQDELMSLTYEKAAALLQ